MSAEMPEMRATEAEGRSEKHLAAIVVPLSDRNTFTDDERISLKHLERHLGAYDRYVVLPEHLDLKMAGFKEKRFSREFFGSVDANRRLMFSKRFYESFADYQYILIYHLDALVFSNRLKEWCQMGLDYIAPPWVRHKDSPYFENPDFEGKVGNGGFSLRNIASFLRVLDSRKLAFRPLEIVKSAIRYGTSIRKYSCLLKFPFYYHPKFNGVQTEMATYYYNEDHFWANRASHYLPSFKVASLDVGIRFAFECAPRYCYELNSHQLPFGCHAWGRYDRAFWEPHLLKA
jgi:hypothetical protein